MPLQFEKLRLSPHQEFVPNNDPATANWPQLFAWTEGSMLLNWTQAVFRRLRELDAGTQAEFWKGNMLPGLVEFLPAIIAKFSPEQIVEYCRVWQSRDTASLILITKARNEKLNPRGAMSFGPLRLDERIYALRMAARMKSVRGRGVPDALRRAIERDDVRFFIRLGKALQSKERPVEVDWTRCEPLACFLVNNWCAPSEYASWLPALCFLTDQALADFCSAAFGRPAGNPNAAAIRQWRRRLGLKQVRSPKIRKVTVKRGEILFA